MTERFTPDPEVAAAVEKLAVAIMEAMWKERPSLQLAAMALVKVVVGTLLQIDKDNRENVRNIFFAEVTDWMANERNLEIIDITSKLDSTRH